MPLLRSLLVQHRLMSAGYNPDSRRNSGVHFQAIEMKGTERLLTSLSVAARLKATLQSSKVAVSNAACTSPTLIGL